MDMDKEITPKPPVYKKRRIWLTVILTIFGFGFPSIYCGYLRLGLWLILFEILLSYIIWLVIGFVPSMTALLVVFMVTILIFAVVLIFNIRMTISTNRRQTPRLKYTWRWIIGIFIVVVLIDIIIDPLMKSYVVETYKMPSISMEPTMFVGDYLMATKGINAEELQYGDILIFKFPLDQDQNYIKRLIAKEGDIIQIMDKQIYRNGEELTEPYIKHIDTQIFPGDNHGRWGRNLRDNMAEIEVPQGKLFVLGDNRDNSADSRFWGFLDEDLVTGKARFIHFSWDSENNRVRWERMGKRLDQ